MWYSQQVRHVLRGAFEAAERNIIGTITHVVTQNPVAALTFDDGPHPEFTPRLLSILESHQARATFFMVGESAQKHPELVKRVAHAGHAIGNHSWNHPSFRLITRHERLVQIRACARAIAPYGRRIFRPPDGEQSMASRLDALWLGYEVVNWSVAADDWCSEDAEWMADRLVSQVRPGSVILLHDGLLNPLEKRYLDREPMLNAVNMALKHLGQRLRFITIPELLQHGQPQRSIVF